MVSSLDCAGEGTHIQSFYITGPINHASVLGQHLVILNSFEVSRELLDLRGGVYSSRPRLVTFSEMYVEFSMPIARG
jgi:hypothetical protein